jgi:cytochrome c biogenesis protein CcmG/thiol:disulfide interchange protein DsbE
VSEPVVGVPADPAAPERAGNIKRRALLTALGVVVLVVVALLVNRATAKHSDSTPLRASLIAAAHLPDCPAAAGSGTVTDGLPSYTFPCLGNGPKVDLAKLRGPLLINIWAGPCTECKVEAPELRSFAAAAQGKVAVLGIVDGAYDGSETWDDALDASHGLGLAYPSVWDANGKFVQYLRVPGIPVSIFVSASGAVTHAKIGVLAPGELAKLSAQYLGVTVPDPK